MFHNARLGLQSWLQEKLGEQKMKNDWVGVSLTVSCETARGHVGVVVTSGNKVAGRAVVSVVVVVPVVQ